MRTAFIPCMALLVLAVLIAGPCVPCFTSSHSCCASCGHCQKTSKCAAASVHLNYAQTAQAGVDVSPVTTAAQISETAAVVTSRDIPVLESPYSPPDLYLRNSTLTI